jgi:hypothetical protein
MTHGDTERQDEEGEGAPSRASHGEPVLDDTLASNAAAVMRFHALPVLRWWRWWVEVVEHCEVEL